MTGNLGDCLPDKIIYVGFSITHFLKTKAQNIFRVILISYLACKIRYFRRGKRNKFNACCDFVPIPVFCTYFRISLYARLVLQTVSFALAATAGLTAIRPPAAARLREPVLLPDSKDFLSVLSVTP